MLRNCRFAGRYTYLPRCSFASIILLEPMAVSDTLEAKEQSPLIYKAFALGWCNLRTTTIDKVIVHRVGSDLSLCITSFYAL